ncbi:MAG: O-antigen ligase family protein [Bacteroidetes bacterium]|nr:O-antigen ligase family protein [Bacteroidota bacterium]
MIKILRPYLVYILIAAFVLIDLYLMSKYKLEFYIYNLLPLIFLIIYISVHSLKAIYLLLAFVTPLSITLKEMGFSESLDLSLPSEPIMISLMFIYIFSNIYQKTTSKLFLNHTISKIILAQLIWMLVTALASTEIIISIKYFIARLWFIFSCYYLVQYFFIETKSFITFVYFYASSLFIVVIYTILHHAQYNFNDKAADWVVSPFYNDHTAYGSALAMFMPLMFSFMFIKSVSKSLKIYAGILLLFFCLGIVLSFARAGWLSLIFALLFFITLKLKIKFGSIIAAALVTLSLFFVFQTEILMALGRNSTDAEGGITNNIESISNISTDASNLERLNRWSCAIRMWKDKPLLGWGPGTYMFKYAPYQLSANRTIISTNFGTNGNAHSEYLGPLSEQGVLGLLFVVILVLSICFMSYRLIYTLKSNDTKILVIGIFLGLVTYFIHGALNNFLDTDKLSLPFWSFIGALVCIDCFSEKKMS